MTENELDYKKYSLESLENWLHNAISEDIPPQEIYDIIKNVVSENYYIYKNQTSRCYELLSLLNGGHHIEQQVREHGELWAKEDVLQEREYYEGFDSDKSPECQKAWNDFWEENYYPEEYQKHGDSDQYTTYTIDELKSIRGTDNSQYTEEELNAMCDKAESDEKDKSRNHSPTELTYQEAIDAGWTMTDDGFWIPPQKEDKVVKWQLPVEVDGLSGDCFVQFPDDLLEAANLKEGDEVEWVDMGDSFILKKVIK